MAEAVAGAGARPAGYQGRPDGMGLVSFLLGELRPRGKLLTPFNVITAPIVLLGAVLIVIRFAYGLGAVTNLSQEFPWGFWIGFDVITGVAFAGGAYVLCFAVYVMGMTRYHGIIRAVVLNGFLAYCFYAGALLLDLGRPWNAFNVIVGNDFGTNSILFVVAWHFMLYTAMLLAEFSPAIAEWLGARRLHKVLTGLTLAAVIFGFTLSTLHQAGLGGLYLLAKAKLHPLWYSSLLPVLFFVSSIFAGLSLVIVEGSISHRVFAGQLDEERRASHHDVLFGLAKGAAVAMFAYLFLQVVPFIHGRNWEHLGTGMGSWFLLEILGFVLVPMLLFAEGIRNRSVNVVRAAAVVSALGVILNRMNVSIVAFKWNAPNHYVPSWMEIVVTLAVVFVELWVFRWIVNRMPVLREPPAWASQEH